MKIRIVAVRTPSRTYPVICGVGATRSARALIRRHAGKGAIFVLSSPRAWKACGPQIRRGVGSREISAVILFDDREESKSLHTVEGLHRKLARQGVERDAIVVAVGGGVVGDVAGFVAATYQRGIRLVHIPTTLVAQVDSAIGGKTGVNLPEGKNLVGAFYQPWVTICDSALLRTLPAREFRSGMFEVIKYGMLGDAALFRFLEVNLQKVIHRDPRALEHIIPRCIRAKAAIVSRDERESGPRELLNLGHTVGHALEAATNYRKYLHGEAIGWGLLAATLLSVAANKMSVADAARIARLVARVANLPPLPKLTAAEMLAVMRRDKKSRAGEIRWILPTGIGHAIRGVAIPDSVFRKAWAELPDFYARSRT